MLQGVTKNIKREEKNIHTMENSFDVIECSPNKKYVKLACKLGENMYKKIYRGKMKVKEDIKIDVIWNIVTISSVQQELINKRSYMTEIIRLRDINHKNIVKVFDCWTSDEDFVVITEDFKDGNLQDWLNKNGPPDREKLRDFLIQIVNGLTFLHEELNIVHKNLKLSNIFVRMEKGREVLKIGDLGFSEVQFKGKMPLVGTPEFFPREMFEGSGYHPSLDIYCVGFLLMQLSTDTWPYDECKGEYDLFKKKLFGHLPNAIQKISDSCLKHFIFRCVTSKMDRISLQDMREHHFIDNRETCKGLCICDKPGVVVQLAISKNEFQSTLISIQKDCLHLQLYMPNTEQFIRFKFAGDKETIEDVMREMVDDEIVRSSFYPELLELFKTSVEKAKKIRSLNISEEGIINIGEIEIKQLQFNERLILDDTQSYPYIGPKTIEEEEYPPADLAVLENNIKNNRAEIEAHHSAEQKASKESSSNNEKISPENSILSPEKNKSQGTPSINQSIHSENTDKLENTINQAVIDQRKGNTEIFTPSEMTVEKPLDIDKRNDIKNTENNQNGKTIEHTNKAESSCQPILSENENELSSPTQKRQCEMIDPHILEKLKIEDFVDKTAAIVNRTPVIANEWVKLLKEHEIDTVEDLRLLVEEDWDSLGLPVFAARAMINLLYGKDKQPVKEKHQLHNSDIPEYQSDLPIKEFINEICKLVYKPDNSSLWEAKLTNQEIRTVGEFKSLHDKDWNKLGLSVFCYRVLKNILNRKGRLPAQCRSDQV